MKAGTRQDFWASFKFTLVQKRASWVITTEREDQWTTRLNIGRFFFNLVGGRVCGAQLLPRHWAAVKWGCNHCNSEALKPTQRPDKQAWPNISKVRSLKTRLSSSLAKFRNIDRLIFGLENWEDFVWEMRLQVRPTDPFTIFLPHNPLVNEFYALYYIPRT